MRIRKIVLVIMAFVLSLISISCNKSEKQPKEIKPQISQMRSISELATMECYYHNVAKFKEEDAEGFWLWKKDKHFWIEYSGVVKIGINASLVTMEVKEDMVTITIPNAKVLDKRVDETSLTEDAYYVDGKSAKIAAEDETKALTFAQENMVKTASEDLTLLASAQQRAQTLLEEYIKNIGNVVGKNYSIEWKYIDEDGSDLSDTSEELSAFEETEAIE